MPSMFVIRWIMVALTAVLAVLLIARGNVVIGVVLGALALTRVALLVRLQQLPSMQPPAHLLRMLDRRT